MSENTLRVFVQDAPRQAAGMLSRMVPQRLAYTAALWSPLWDTVLVATFGTVGAVTIAVPIGFLAARTTSPAGGILRPMALFLVSCNAIDQFTRVGAVAGNDRGSRCTRGDPPNLHPVGRHSAADHAHPDRNHGLSVGHQHSGINRAWPGGRGRNWFAAPGVHQHPRMATGFDGADPRYGDRRLQRIRHGAGSKGGVVTGTHPFNTPNRSRISRRKLRFIAPVSPRLITIEQPPAGSYQRWVPSTPMCP